MLSSFKSACLASAGFCVLLAIGFNARAQSIYGTITGTVADASGAVVPNANVTLTNASSGDNRKTVTNSDGYYSFSSAPAGTYSVLVDAPGFERSETTGIELVGAANLNFNFGLKIGSSKTEVQVVSAADQIIPVDSGEKAVVLTQKQMQDFPIVGANAAEFIKILPGFAARNNGDNMRNGSDYSGQVIGINGNGDGGSQSPLNGAYVANGAGVNNIDITADGAHVSDPGCNCATPVNPNTDMIQEFKVLTSNFNAENSKGPIVINTVAKAGGKDFHGEGYFSARNYTLNSNNWINNYSSTPRPENQFYYPGGNISGPILIPHTGLNKNRDKLFFFTGYEYYKQTLDTGLLAATVPTQGMRNGDFSAAQLSQLGIKTSSGTAAPALNGCITGATAASSCATQVNNGLYGVAPNNVIPAGFIDPTGKNLINLLPLPNTNPDTDGGYNWTKDEIFPQNSWQWLSRVDYNISDNTKLFVRYNLQREVQQFPVSLWWRNANSVPYPTPVLGKNSSQSVSASLTHVFSPTLSNEFVFAFTYIGFPNVFQNPAKVNRTDLNIPFQGLYHNGVQQVPSYLTWGGDFATIFNPGGFEAGGAAQGLYANKWLPSFGDNLSKVWGTHTMKFGMYYEHVINKQPANGYSNGLIVEADNWGGPTGNAYADLLTGNTAQYTEQNFNDIHNEGYNTIEFFGQDSWKVSRRLTVDYGIRLSHLGAWYDKQGYGFAVWEPNLYSPTAPITSYPGFTWNKINNNVPISGFPNRALFYAPRFGLAYDVFGDGKTVFRGGWGMFYYHNAQFTQGLDVPEGTQAPTLSNLTFSQIQQTNPSTQFGGSQGLNPHDDREPLTTSYSATISRQLPFSSLFEISYVGNKNKYQLNPAGVGTNVNALPYGTLFNLGSDPGATSLSTNQYLYGPFPTYQAVNVANHNLYSNYNSMQISWVRQKGNYDISLNYTWSKAMGIVGQDQLNLNNDYGAEPFDRRHIINAAYSVQLPSPLKGNLVARGLVNGWQISGITGIQSGINLTGTSLSLDSGQAFNVTSNVSSGITANNAYNSIVNAGSINGTYNIPLNPIITCNPTANLAPHQYLNGNCFALPTTPGSNGPIVPPEYFGPWFFNSDLSLFKNFQISEAKKLQFRFEAYNFLNHPIWSFTSNGVGSNNINLTYNAAGQQSNTTFGYAPVKLGQRVIEMAVKFYF